MESPAPALPQLSSYLQPTHGVNTPHTNLEIAISALTRHFESHLHKRNQSSSSASEGVRMTLSPEFGNKLYEDQVQRETQSMMERSSVSISHEGDVGELSPTTPRRERTSRYLSEGDRKEIIARIDGGEKQVALAREFKVSRAAICNLYKNRWEVLTRGVRDPTSTHPKRSRKKASPRQTSPGSDKTASMPLSTILDIPFKFISSPFVGRAETPSPFQTAERRRDEFLSWPSTPLNPSQDQSRHLHHQMHHHNLPRDPRHHHHHNLEVESRHRNSYHHNLGTGSGPVVTKPFLVHEASAYSYPCRNLVATLRGESIDTAVFQQRATRLARLLIEEAVTCMPHDEEEITNSYGDLCHIMKPLDASDFCAVSMEDKGMVLLRAFMDISPASSTGVVSVEEKMSGDNPDAPSRHIVSQLPPTDSRDLVLLLDIECGAGEKACAVLHHLVNERHIPARNIYFATIISAFEGLQHVFRHFPGESSGFHFNIKKVACLKRKEKKRKEKKKRN
ncbi:unnamed protein product [Phytophthora fragariaefolia]|uniref:Unnamed protein product n=1 Tax=Phytophthora fragariaefolia TaxID=1490495 RepID=A0A9W6YJ86_9STRA|nr:unnamed protein product [Phytophthora fragariaefolia]